MIYLGRKKGKLFHFYDLNAKYHRELPFFIIENFDIKELRKLEIFDDHLFEMTNFEKDILMIRES